MTAKWQAGHTYVPGDLVVPATAQTQNLAQPTNAGFETGDLTGWTASYGTWAVTTEHYAGTYGAQLTGGAGGLDMSTKADIRAGQVVTASAMAMLVNSGNDDGDAAIALLWFDDAGNSVGTAAIGNHIRGKGGFYAKTSVSASAPDGATKVLIRLTGTSPSSGGHLHYDAVAWSANIPAVPAGLVYRATQAGPGKSGSVEPTWPATTGVPVTDNQVTWEGVIATRLVWKAEPLLKSGTTEPTWPTVDDGVVKDNIIDWQAVTPRVTDSLCPASKIVTIAANKVFVGDGDVVRYCATNDATDWTSEQDAGYLPTGLQAVGETECTALGIYRGNLVAWTASSMEVWQVDPDPARMAIVDTVEGVGTTFVRAAIGMMNDLFFLSPLGVRSVSTSATTGTMGAADVGSPVDPLVVAAINTAIAAGIDPVGVFYSNASQFWIFLGAEAYVYTISQATGIKAWSRCTFPWSVTHACVKDGRLYVRTTGNDVYVLDEALRVDYTSATTAQTYDVTVQWPWLDLSSPGSEKMMVGVDVVCEQDAPGAGLSISGDLPDATQGDTITYQYTVTGIITPITVTLVSGALPTGLSIDSAGKVTGTITAHGAFSWTLRATDALGNTADLDDSATVASTDILTYATVNDGNGQSPTGIAVADGIILVGLNNSQATISTDRGQTWATNGMTGIVDPQAVLAPIKFGGDWYAFASGSAARCIGDSFAFASITRPTNGVTCSANLNGDLYVSQNTGANTQIAKMATTAPTWAYVDFGANYGTVNAMIYVNGAYLFATDGGYILRSTNLVTFSTVKSGGGTFSGLASKGLTVVAANLAGSWYASMDGGATWGTAQSSPSMSYLCATPSMLIGCRVNQVYTSPDAVTWTLRHTATLATQYTGGAATDGTTACFPRQFNYATVGTP